MSNLVGIAYPDTETAKEVRSSSTRTPPRPPPLSAASCSATPGEVLPRIADFGGEVVHSTLSSDQEKTLEDALARRAA